MKTKENNYTFIDSQNLNLGIQSLGWRLDYRRFRIYLKEKYDITVAYLFLGFIHHSAFILFTLFNSNSLPRSQRLDNFKCRQRRTINLIKTNR